MVYIYAPYRRSAAEVLPTPGKPLPAQEAPGPALGSRPPPPPPPRVNLTTLPAPLIHIILSYLPSPHLSTLSKTSALLHSITLTYLTSRHQHALGLTRSLQASVIAANLPNELLQEVLSYLTPLDFYNAAQVCSTWRGAASYPRLVRKNVFFAQPPKAVPPAGDLDGELKTLAFYLQASGRLPRGPSPSSCTVSTLYLKPQGEEMLHPEIHPSENGLYFLAAERVWPRRVHVYSTCRLVLPEDTDVRGGSRGFHKWDVTPTYILTLPDTGLVVSASFGQAIYGGVEYDKKTKSYSRGLDLLVLFEGAKGRLYKIRAASRTDSKTTPRKALGRRVLGWATSENSAGRQKWRIWDSMVFPNVCPFPGGPMIAKLWQSRRVIFAAAGHLEVWKGINELKASGERGGGGEVWDKDAAVRKIYRIPEMLGKVAGISMGFIWHSGLGKDVDYIVCSNSHVEGSEEGQDRSMIENTPSETPGKTLGPQKPSTAGSTAIITPAESFTFNYTHLVECQDYIGSPLFLGLTPNTLTQLKLISTIGTLDNWHPDAWSRTPYQPYPFITKPTIPTPSTFTHIAAVCIPGRSAHPVIAATNSSGNIYIRIPPPCSGIYCPASYDCPSSSYGFTKVARVPPETGGRITHVRISFRCAVWASRWRGRLHEEDLGLTREGVLVLVVTTDAGRAEVCYFEFGAKELRGLVGRWEVDAGKVMAR